MGISPHLSLLLDLSDGEIICIEDKTTIGDRLLDEVEDVEDVFKSGAERAGDFIREDVGHLVGDSVEDILDKVIDGRGDEPVKDYIAVEPDLSGIGSEVEKDEEPAEEVKIWTPDTDGDGKVAIFHPEQDEEDQD